MLRELLDKAEGKKGSFDPDLHAKIMTVLEDPPGDEMSLTVLFRTASYLQNAVAHIAAQNDWLLGKSRPDGRGGRVSDRVVDESKFPAEMTLLHLIQDMFEYSPALADWIAAQREGVAAQLTQNGFRERLLGWADMAVEERRQLLQDIVALNMKAYDGNGLVFTVPPVEFSDDLKGSAARNHTVLTDIEGKILPITRAIEAGAGLRDATSAYNPVRLMIHETIHALITQLAAARMRGGLPEDHPLYGDATVALAERLYGKATPLIPSVYEGNFEEKFVYGCEDRFSDSWVDAISRTKKAAAPAPAV